MLNKEFQTEYQKLNNQQKLAVDTIEGPVMVVAGPGTGKTQILAMRIANILRETQVNPSNILCLTFTNSGVQAMKNRLLQIIGPASYQIHVHTFHSFCNEVINSYPEKFLTAKKLNQLTDLEQIQIIQDILQKNNYKDIKPFKAPFHYQHAIIQSIKNLKEENISPDKYKELIEKELAAFDQIEDLYHEKGAYKGRMKAKYETYKTDLQKNLELADIYDKYQTTIRDNGKYDFSDMILFVINAFENDPEILATYQERYQYILVDEYQDTNSGQNKIVELIGSFYDNPNIFVVGDDEQSIFRFQGASLENILFFKETYPETKIIVLENNYRSIQKILDVSRAVIQNNQNQIFNALEIAKKLKSQRDDLKGDIELGEFSSGPVESFFVAKKIAELINPSSAVIASSRSNLSGLDPEPTPTSAVIENSLSPVIPSALSPVIPSVVEGSPSTNPGPGESLPRHSGLDPEPTSAVIASPLSPVIPSAVEGSPSANPSPQALNTKYLIPDTAVSPSQIAILYKEHHDATEIIDFLSKLNIPYVIEIGGDILEDPEIDKIITYLKALNFGVKMSDNQLLIEILHYPFFGISPLDIYKVIIKSRELKQNLFDTLASPKILKEMDLGTPDAISEFTKTFLDCRHIANSQTFAHAFEHIINATGYLNYLLTLNESVHHLNRLQTLFDEIKLLNTKDKHLKLSGFLDHIELLQENSLPIKTREISATYEGVHLMTAHKSKGLEFDYAFLIHLTDKHWGNKTKKELIKLPSGILRSKPTREENDEEERRLFYVALTRAKKQIYLTYANQYGQSDSPTLTVPSKFISEIPQAEITKVDAKKYEDSFDERLLLSFAEKKWQPSEALEEFLRNLIKDFKLSPTALNSYLECPQRFFYDNILRVPKTKDFTQSYGTAVHRALELLFMKYKRDFALPSKEEFIQDFIDALQEEIFSDEDLERARQRGTEILSQYYDFYTNEWQGRGAPLSCEFNFAAHDVHFRDIPITGKIDRIDLIDKTANNVRIIDYKTASPKSQNYLMGQTKEADTNYLYQAYFYKLLADNDPLFNWKVGDIEFDFISPEGTGESQKFKKVALPIDHDEYTAFQKTVEEVYDKIIALDFHLEEPACKNGKGECPYFKICHSVNK